MSVQKAAHEVRAYPVEVITQSTTRVELSVKSCVEAAERARKTYDAAQQLVRKVEWQMLLWVIAASMLSAMTTATIIFLKIRQ